MRDALLSGEHPTLPAAELRALLDVHEPAAALEVRGVLARIDGGGGVDAALRRMALVHAWGEPWHEAADSPEGLDAAAAAVAARADGSGSVAVAAERRGHDAGGLRKAHVERRIGEALRSAGHTVDLERPDATVYAWLADGRLRVGRLLGTADRGAFEARVSDKRDHFSPVGLHPRRAASLLHLARVAPGGTVYDPFCGTGGFILEAALEGYQVLASDLDAFMVQGTLQALTDVGPEPLDADAFVADVGDAPALVAAVDGVVTDLPYGRASTTDLEGIDALYPRAWAAIAQVLKPGAFAVVGHADPRLLPDAPAAGLRVVERHEERAHKSLTRHFAVLRKAPGT